MERLIEEQNSSLLEKLREYSQSDYYPFHMPGHKRREITELCRNDRLAEKDGGFPNPFSIDITEIDGFDNLHHAEGILRASMESVAEIYGADHSYYLVNGSTCGILSAVCGCTKAGGKLLMARNCHKAAYHGAILHQLETEYIYPQYLESYGINGGVLAEDVRVILEKNRADQEYQPQCVDEKENECGKTAKKIEAVLIVSPTYEGIVSDIREIADVVHSYGIPLIVDEAHGAHFPFGHQKNTSVNGEAGSKFPASALDCGADVVIQSLHKTLPCFTQTAVMHIKGDFVKRSRIERYLGMFQSSSPSYLFLAAMERCIQYMNGDGREEMERYAKRLEECYERLKQCRILHILNSKVCEEESVFDWDMSKVVISARQAVYAAKKLADDSEQEGAAKFGGEALGEILREQYHLEMEMTAPEYVIAMTSLMDTEDGLKRLSDALLEIDGKICDEILQIVLHESLGEEKKKTAREQTLAKLPKADSVMKLADAMEAKSQRVTFSDSLNMISQEFVYLYPPGIPVLAPGERITKEILERIAWYQSMGLSVQGISDPSLYSIITVAEE